ncbi:hypothetical protein [Lentzea guizhouensis]|uniref:hypothetical protein n=1 Tax=Lentzea guizhouensis TaxID=1586287 RepID=UPI0012B67FA0|nr:hypothetical protein [Lentzea guizhouensis]
MLQNRTRNGAGWRRARFSASVVHCRRTAAASSRMARPSGPGSSAYWWTWTPLWMSRACTTGACTWSACSSLRCSFGST